VAQHGVTVNNLLPGPFNTDRLYKTMEGSARQSGLSIEEVAKRRAAQNPSRRFGEPAEFGAACAFLCSRQAAYMTGQNVLLDGGAYPGTF
jgi:3-oxoacyl-[acyl-carrier protein] reductase